VISENPGFLTGGSLDAEEAADPVLAESMHASYQAADDRTAREISILPEQKKAEKQSPVAPAGRLPVMVDVPYGPIKAGHHLTSSKTPGHAMAMLEAGPSIGVALESWNGPGPGSSWPSCGAATTPLPPARRDAGGPGTAGAIAGRAGEPTAPRTEVFRVDERGDVWAHGVFRPRICLAAGRKPGARRAPGLF